MTICASDPTKVQLSEIPANFEITRLDASEKGRTKAITQHKKKHLCKTQERRAKSMGTSRDNRKRTQKLGLTK